MKTKLVIDTDAGTDPDDLFAIVYALSHPNAEVKAITTVHGDTVLRSKIVRKLGRLLGIEIPITAGAERPLVSNKMYLGGFEHKGLNREEHAEEFKSASFPEYDKDTTLVSIAPFTNIAMQLQNKSSILNVKNIYCMGYNKDSHNFLVDPDATDIVMNHSWNKYCITKEVSSKIKFTRKELHDLKGTELGDFLCESAIRGIDGMKREDSWMYDVLTVSAALGEPYVKFVKEGNRFISYDVDLELKDKLVEAIKKWN